MLDMLHHDAGKMLSLFSLRHCFYDFGVCCDMGYNIINTKKDNSTRVMS